MTVGIAGVNGAKLSYEVAGRGHPLVLIHAGVADSRMWDDQFEFFSRHFRVVRYDIRGFGRSSRATGSFSNVDDLRALLGVLGVARAHLGGVSLGARIALDLALLDPQVVSALLLVAPGVRGHRWSEAVQRYGEAEEAAFAAGDLARAADLAVRMWVDGPLRTAQEVDARIREKVREMQLHAYGLQAMDAEDRSLEPPAIARLGEVRAPTLVVVGDQDVPDILSLADLLVRGIAGARKALIPDAAHLPSMEKPAEFNRVVLEFLSGLSATS